MRSSNWVPADPEGYRLIEPVDPGEMRLVWRAQHVATGDARLVSLLPGTDDPSPLARIEQETQLLTKLPEIAIAAFVEIVPHEAGWALIAEDRSDQSLRTFVAEHGPVSAPDAVRALAPVADALAATHRIKLVHGDVNSATVLVTSKGTCALGEFGVSRYLRDSHASAPTPTPISMMAAPEIWRAERALPAADVYGFGRVLLYLLSGDADLSDPLVLVSEGKSRPSSSLVAVIEQCLRPDPLDRPADGDALVRLLSRTTESGAAANCLPTPSVQSPATTNAAGRAAAKTNPVVETNPSSNSGRNARLGTAVISLVVLVAFAFAVFRPPGASEDSGRSDPGAAPRPARPVTAVVTTVSQAAPCPAIDAGKPVDLDGRPLSPEAERFDGDLNGDGCPDRLHWWRVSSGQGGWRAHATLSGRDDPVVLALGDPGDLLFLGAWACTAARTPALYRPSTGEVFMLTAWPEAGERLDLAASRRLSPQRRPSVGTSDAGCDLLVE